jgi:signal transduction histidine kinase
LFAITDRIIVLREGKLVGNFKTDDITREEVVAASVGSGQQQRTPAIWALDSYYKARQQAEILTHNQLLLEQDLAARDVVNQELLKQLSKQIKALDSTNLALQDAQRRLLTERETERKHLARELHDETIQELLSLNYQLEENSRLAVGNEPLLAEINDMRCHVRQMVANTRGICRNLRPPALDSLGLGAALKSFADRWSDQTGIVMKLTISEISERFPEAIELSIFRIVQESLNNVWKHSDASQVEVTLEFTSPRVLTMMIADDGVGLPDDFDLSALSHSGHFGLLGISERVALLGGGIQFEDGLHGGLIIHVQIPVPKGNRDD